MSKTVVIMRGLPGAGKSTSASELEKELSNRGLTSVVVSTDHFFIDPNGEYRFKPELLKKAHSWNKTKFNTYLEGGQFDVIIVDNTNTQYWEMSGYVESAKDCGYAVIPWTIWPREHFTLNICDERNTHGVPRESIEKMMNRFHADTHVIAEIINA